jgi:hypothetical protein
MFERRILMAGSIPKEFVNDIDEIHIALDVTLDIKELIARHTKKK